MTWGRRTSGSEGHRSIPCDPARVHGGRGFEHEPRAVGHRGVQRRQRPQRSCVARPGPAERRDPPDPLASPRPGPTRQFRKPDRRGRPCRGRCPHATRGHANANDRGNMTIDDARTDAPHGLVPVRCSAPFYLLTLALAGCGLFGPGYLEIREVTVGPTLAKCYGAGLQSCMVVDGGLFHDQIEGFTFEAGYDHRLRIGKHDPWDGEPPQDAGLYAYRLLEQLEKTVAPSTPATPVGGAGTGDVYHRRRLLPGAGRRVVRRHDHGLRVRARRSPRPSMPTCIATADTC